MDFSGMSLNERLFEAGLLSDFDAAFEKRDRKSLINLLVKVQVEEQQAEKTVDELLTNPKFYGFES